MPARTPSSARSPDARDRLLECASTLFANHGYQAIGLRDLANHLGLQAGSLYHHIESKQGLLFELIESSLTDLLYETRQCLKGRHSASERLLQFVQTFISFSQAHPDRFILLTREVVNLSDEQLQQVQELKATYITLLSGIIVAECGLCGPSAAPHARSIAQAVLSLLCGHAQWGALAERREHLLAFVQGIVRSGETVHR